jgi:hypothetical protein
MMNRRAFLQGTAVAATASTLPLTSWAQGSASAVLSPWTVGHKFRELLLGVSPGSLVVTHHLPQGLEDVLNLDVPLFFMFETDQDNETSDEDDDWPELAVRTRHVAHHCLDYVHYTRRTGSIISYDLNGRRTRAAEYQASLIVEFEPDARWDRAGSIHVVKNRNGQPQCSI